MGHRSWMKKQSAFFQMWGLILSKPINGKSAS